MENRKTESPQGASPRRTRALGKSLLFKITVMAGLMLLGGICTWSFLSIRHYHETIMDNVVSDVDRLSNTIKLGTHYSMMLDSREDIRQIIKNVSRQEGIEKVRIYNKLGEIMFSNKPEEVGTTTDIKEKACYVCHKDDPPLVRLTEREGTRLFQSPGGEQLLGIISPIYNEPGCSGPPCHVHPENVQVLGLLDMVVSLENTEASMSDFRRKTALIAVLVFLATFAGISLFIVKFIKRPISTLIAGTRLIAETEQYTKVDVHQEDEMGELARAITKMSREISDKHAELNRQRDEYQNLFELVPCLITAQDRDFRLVSYNKEFADKFNPTPGDFCYRAYKGRDSKCENCPVERTFADGRSHVSEEAGFNKDGTRAHWIVTTSPIKDPDGNIVAAMEVSLDITQRKILEEQLAKSEQKYQAIFSNIPNAVFVLDADSLEILDGNEAVTQTYGYEMEELQETSFLDFFREGERDEYARAIRGRSMIDKVRHTQKNGSTIFVTIRISPSEYPGRRVLLVSCSDITKRLETEQNLIQASKMATLGEMATGVAHEINQPLSVIKTASSYFIRKVRKKEPIKEETLEKMAGEISSYVDRATKIINHLREFGRKPEMSLEPLDLNETIQKAFELFSQQLKVRDIEVDWRLEEELPRVMGDPSRLEQVFINLLLNARDAIEEALAGNGGKRRITIITRGDADKVEAEIRDTGKGIPDAIRDRIFEPFFTTKSVGKGTGLGLSISYGIVQDCGGNIEAKNPPGGGTAFVLTFRPEGVEEASG